MIFLVRPEGGPTIPSTGRSDNMRSEAGRYSMTSPRHRGPAPLPVPRTILNTKLVIVEGAGPNCSWIGLRSQTHRIRCSKVQHTNDEKVMMN